MMEVARHAATPVWLLLVAATGLSWLLGHQGGDHRSGSIAVIVIAAGKIRFVLLRFMELRAAPLAWRIVFEAWLAIVTLGLVSLYLTSR